MSTSPPGSDTTGRLRRCSARLWWWALDYLFVLTSWLRAAHRPAWPEPRTGGAGRVPVVLIPGIYESWRFLEPVARALHGAGHPVHVIPLGLNRAGLRSTAARVCHHLRRHRLGPVVLVAHSKGGLIGKQVLIDLVRRHALDGARTCAVHGLVTVAAPFAGSRYAPYFPVAALRALGPRPLSGLGAEVALNERIVAIRSHFDPHIPAAPDLPGARNVVVPAAGHFRILADAGTQAVLLDAVAQTARHRPLWG